jgi:excisionase family DNA binding protein
VSPTTFYRAIDTGSRPLGGSVLIDQACELLGVSKRKVYYLIREGRLRTIRTRCHSQRILLDSIAEVLAAGADRRRGVISCALPPDHSVAACS